MRGYLIIKNLRTGESRKAHGIFTRNFAYILLHVLNTFDNVSEEYDVKDFYGNTYKINARPVLEIPQGNFFYHNIYTYIRNVSGWVNLKTGLTAWVTESDYTPSPNDYRPPTTDLEIPLKSKSIIMNPNNTQIIFTGSEVTNRSITIKGVGIFNKIYPKRLDPNYPDMPYWIMIDGFAISPLEFSANDVVSVSYRITLA
jgi:hypothetical protein